MALDEPKATDETFDIDGFQFIVDKEFLKKAAPIKVDFKDIGFSITSSIQINTGSGCSSCSTCG